MSDKKPRPPFQAPPPAAGKQTVPGTFADPAAEAFYQAIKARLIEELKVSGAATAGQVFARIERRW